MHHSVAFIGDTWNTEASAGTEITRICSAEQNKKENNSLRLLNMPMENNERSLRMLKEWNNCDSSFPLEKKIIQTVFSTSKRN